MLRVDELYFELTQGDPQFSSLKVIMEAHVIRNLLCLTILATVISTLLCLYVVMPQLRKLTDSTIYEYEIDGNIDFSKIGYINLVAQSDRFVMKTSHGDLYFHIPVEYRKKQLSVQASDPHRVFNIREYDNIMQSLSQGQLTPEIRRTALLYRDAFFSFVDKRTDSNMHPFYGAYRMIDQLLLLDKSVSFWRPPLPWTELYNWTLWLLSREGGISTVLLNYPNIVNSILIDFQPADFKKDGEWTIQCTQCDIHDKCPTSHRTISKKDCGSFGCKFLCSKKAPIPSTNCNKNDIIEILSNAIIEEITNHSFPKIFLIMEAAKIILKEALRTNNSIYRAVYEKICTT